MAPGRHQMRSETDIERAVAPLISVMLMVLLTVVIASVVGTFVMDVSRDGVDSPPRTSISVRTDTGNHTITVQHEGGDPLVDSETTVRVTNESSGRTLTFLAGTGDAVFSTSDRFEIHVDIGTGAELVDGPWATRTADGSMTLATGVAYTVRFIDTETDRTIAEVTVHG